MVKSGEKLGKSGEKWEKVGKSDKWELVKMWEWFKVAKSVEKWLGMWRKVVKSGEKVKSWEKWWLEKVVEKVGKVE